MIKIIKYLLGIVCLLLFSGFIYQFIATKIDNKKYLPPGKIVDIGGYKLHLHCIGKRKEGKPTVILDAALGGFSLDWMPVQTKVAQFAHVCSYDRAGYGWSEESPKPRISKYIVEELHQLLDKAKETGPFILVGSSFGGVNTRLFACQFPEQTAGVVLVDASHEDIYEKIPKMPFQSLTDFVTGEAWLVALGANIGLVRLFQKYNAPGSLPVNYTSEIKKAYVAKISTSAYIKTVSAEYTCFVKSLADMKKGCGAHKPELGDIPLRVITAGKSDFQEKMSRAWIKWKKERDSAWRFMQNDLLTKSSNSKQVIAKESGHMIPREQPQIIVDEIRDIIESK